MIFEIQLTGMELDSKIHFIMQDQHLTESELADEVLITSDTINIFKALVIYAVILTIGTTLCIWTVDFRSKGTFSTIRGENISQENAN